MKTDLPKTIDGYPVERIIGEGAFSTVYLVRLPGRQRFAALKLLKGEVDPGEFLRLRREFTAISRCQHANIVGVYGFGEYHHRPYYLMEYIKGKDISESLRRGYGVRRCLSAAIQEHLVEYLIQILNALDYLHTHRLIHRDLKPPNLLVDDTDNSVKLLDFGLAWHGTGEDGGAGFGTPGYQAPEQIQGKGADPRSDLYALGVSLYEILCGIHPFNQGQSWQELIQVQMEGRFVLPGEMFPGECEQWDNLIYRLLAVDPTDRYQSAGQVLMEVRRLFDLTESTAAGPAGTWGLLDVDYQDTGGQLAEMLTELESRKNSLLAYHAPARAGKSHFLRQLKTAVTQSARPVILLEPTVEPDPVIQTQILADFVATLIQNDPDLLTEYQDSARQFLSPGSDGVARTPISRRTRFLQMLERGAASASDAVILLDDADAAGGLLMECLSTLGSGTDSRVQIVLTFSGTLPAISSLIPREWLPATDIQIDLFVRLMLGMDQVSRRFITQITALSEGNIGLVRDAFSAWLENSALVFRLGTWFLGPPALDAPVMLAADETPAPAELPETTRYSLPDDRLEREVLRTLAVYGHHCPFQLLKGAFAAREELLLEVLDRLIKNGWIQEDINEGEAWYRFQRRGMAESIYRSISPFHLSNLHKKFAELLEKRKDRQPNLNALLAYHFSRSDTPEQALNYLMEVAEDARDRFENQVSLQRFSNIQEIALAIRATKPFSRPGPDGMVVLFSQTSPSQAERLYLQCQTSIANEFEILWMTAAREKGKILAGIGEYGRAFEEFQRMHTKARDIHARQQEAEALRFIGQVKFYQRKYSEAEQHLLEAMDIFMEMEIPKSIGDCLNALGATAFQQQRMDAAKSYFEKAIAFKRQDQDMKGVAYLVNNLGNIEFSAGNHSEALRQYQESYDLLQTVRDTLGMAYSCFNIGETYQAMGEFEKALPPLEEALELRRRMDDLRGAAYCYQELAVAHHELGHRKESVQNFHEAREIFEQLGQVEEVSAIDRQLAEFDGMTDNS